MTILALWLTYLQQFETTFIVLQHLETRTEFLPDEGFSEDAGGTLGEQNLGERLPTQQPEMYAPPPRSEVLEAVEPTFDVQKWSSDYQYLAQAVYNADQDQSGECHFNLNVIFGVMFKVFIYLHFRSPVLKSSIISQCNL